MTALDFQKKHRQALADFLASEIGRDLLATLHDLRMQPKGSANSNADSYTLGGIAGYEQCEKNILALSLVPKTPVRPVRENYGVPDKTPEEEAPKA